MDLDHFGEVRTVDLVENGRNVSVTDDNKRLYVKLACNMKLIDAIRDQMKAFLDGFYELVPQKDIAIFDEQVRAVGTRVLWV